MEVEIASRANDLMTADLSKPSPFQYMFMFGVVALVSGVGFSVVFGGFGVGVVGLAIVCGAVTLGLVLSEEIKPYRKSVAAALLAEQ